MAESGIVVALGKPRRLFGVGSLALLKAVWIDSEVTWGILEESMNRYGR